MCTGSRCCPGRSLPAQPGSPGKGILAQDTCQSGVPQVLSRLVSEAHNLMFHGSIVALITPMDERGRVDLDALLRAAGFSLVAAPARSVVAGTTGESSTLSDAEFETAVVAHHRARAMGSMGSSPVPGRRTPAKPLSAAERRAPGRRCGLAGDALLQPSRRKRGW